MDMGKVSVTFLEYVKAPNTVPLISTGECTVRSTR